MENKEDILKKSLEFLDKYLKETPKEEIEKTIAKYNQVFDDEITVKEYFENFHSNFNGYKTMIDQEKGDIKNEIEQLKISKSQINFRIKELKEKLK